MACGTSTRKDVRPVVQNERLPSNGQQRPQQSLSPNAQQMPCLNAAPAALKR